MKKQTKDEKLKEKVKDLLLLVELKGRQLDNTECFYESMEHMSYLRNQITELEKKLNIK